MTDDEKKALVIRQGETVAGAAGSEIFTVSGYSDEVYTLTAEDPNGFTESTPIPSLARLRCLALPRPPLRPFSTR